jgi:hypothetical protein
MSTIVRTEYVNVNGSPKVRAKCAGRQKTTNWDLSRSTDWNHGTAAGALILALGQNDSWIVGDAIESIDEGNAAHDSNDSGTKHGFQF